MFVRLISARQVVILCDATDTYLFYRGEVYNRRTVDGFSGLPRFRGEYCPVWALLDGDFKGGPPITTTSNIWPIHTTSPNPERWKAWSKQNMAAVLGMPLWNMEELIEGYVACPIFLPPTPAMLFDRGSPLTTLHPYYSLSLWPEYEDFRSILAQHLLTLNTTGNVVVDAALEVLRAEREGEEEEERDRDATGHGTGSSAANQDATTSGKATWEAVDHALKILVRNATEEFGFAPRDVYRGVFRLPTIRMEHADAVKSLNCSQLKTIAEVFSKDCQLDVSSHHVVSVSPCDGSPDRDKWTIDFKSIRIAKEVAVSMRLEEDRTIRKVYGLLHDVPASSAMAGRIFESIVHRMFSGGEEEIMWAPIPMTSNDLDPPAFSVVPYPTYFLKMRPRALTQVNLNRNLKFSNITLDNDKYYTPTASTNPLFDSFIIDSDSDNTVLSIFQITTSPRSGGSGSGYLLIRKIMTRVCELLEEKHKTTNVQVEYFLVCPQSEAQRVWQMPFDWGKNITKHDHRGDAFFIPVPTSLV